MLEQFKTAKQAEIEELQEQADAGTLPSPWPEARPGFAQALQQAEDIAIIAEYKRASPSRGKINTHLKAGDAGNMFKTAGAAAISVLTIKDWFAGDLRYLFDLAPTGLPLLRKDFILHPLQVRQTAATPAAALLLIGRMLGSYLPDLLRLTHQAGLEAVVEVFTADDLAIAQACGSRIIQVNNRDLETLQVDHAAARRLINYKQPHETWIAASGITQRQELVELHEAGYDAVLIGSAIMSHSDPQTYIQTLRGKAIHAD